MVFFSNVSIKRLVTRGDKGESHCKTNSLPVNSPWKVNKFDLRQIFVGLLVRGLVTPFTTFINSLRGILVNSETTKAYNYIIRFIFIICDQFNKVFAILNDKVSVTNKRVKDTNNIFR